MSGYIIWLPTDTLIWKMSAQDLFASMSLNMHDWLLICCMHIILSFKFKFKNSYPHLFPTV